jgi:hypothetical protein
MASSGSRDEKAGDHQRADVEKNEGQYQQGRDHPVSKQGGPEKQMNPG